MRVKRATYATRPGNDEIVKLSLEIKVVLKKLQEDLKKKKDKVLDYYAKMIQSLKREYQIVHAEKNKLKDFLKKQEEEKQRTKQESLIKEHAKQMDLYSKMLAMQKRKQNSSKRRRYYDSDRG